MALADSKTMKAMVEFREHTGKRGFKIEPCLLVTIKLGVSLKLFNAINWVYDK